MIMKTLDLESLLKAARPTNPPRGGKYVRREWTGTRWKYYYADSPAAHHGAATPRDHNDPLFSHSLEVQLNNITDDPEKDYKAALDRALSEPGASFPVAHPHGEGEWKLEVREDKKGNKVLALLGEDGQPLKKDSGQETVFDSRGAYEAWYIGAATTTVIADENGEPWLDVKPNVGQVKNGELVPSKDKNRAWVVAINDAYKRKHGVKRKKWQYPTRERAEKHASQMVRDRRVVSGETGVLGGIESLPKEEQQAIKQAMEEGGAMHAPSGSVADMVQSGKLPYRAKEGGKGRELDISDTEKARLVSQAAVEYWPAALGLADTFASNEWFKRDDRENAFGNAGKRGWMERFLGEQLPDRNDETLWDKEKQRPRFLAPDPDSPYFKAIESALDNYDPAYGVGFTGYLVGKRGKVWSKMRNAQDDFIEEIKGSGAGTVQGSEGEEKQRGEITSASPEEAAGRGHLQSADEATGEFQEWKNSVTTLLNAWEDHSPDDNPEIREKVRDVIEQIKDLPAGERREYAQQVSQMLLDLGVREHAEKAMRWQKAIEAIRQDPVFVKAA